MLRITLQLWSCDLWEVTWRSKRLPPLWWGRRFRSGLSCCTTALSRSNAPMQWWQSCPLWTPLDKHMFSTSSEGIELSIDTQLIHSIFILPELDNWCRHSRVGENTVPCSSAASLLNYTAVSSGIFQARVVRKLCNTMGSQSVIKRYQCALETITRWSGSQKSQYALRNLWTAAYWPPDLWYKLGSQWGGCWTASL